LSKLRDLAAQLGVSPPRRRWRVAVAAIATVLGVCTCIAIAGGRDRSTVSIRPAAVPADVHRSDAAIPEPSPPARPPSPAPTGTSIAAGPSRVDARAIDRELEARYGGRPTVAPNGGVVIAPTRDTAVVPRRDPLATAASSTAASPPAPGPTPTAVAAAVEPSWLLRSKRLDGSKPVVAASGSKLLGVATGSHVAARLVTRLDSRTVSAGPVEARVTRPLIVRGEVVVPSGTLLFGKATAGDARFFVRFDRMRLPDDRELDVAAIAIERGDGTPGLPASRRITGANDRSGSSVGSVIARGSATTVLNTLTGGLAQDLVRDAGHAALQRADAVTTSHADTAILDPGIAFDVWIEKPL
jgi:hypothetical protein